MGLPPIEHICLFWTYTEAPSLHRSYPASSVLRASPPSQSARPFSRELPVDPYCNHRWDFPCCAGPLCLHAVANTPAGPMETCSLVPFHSLRPSPNRGGSAPALVFSRPAQRLLTLRPACSPSRLCDLLHRRLQQLRCLRRCFDCYRVERTSSRAGFTLPLWITAFSRRTTMMRLGR